MNFDLDQYFTPTKVAERLVESCDFTELPNHCVDPACGAGDLLTAADKVFRNSSCTGLDKDATAIARLKKQRPEWTLSVANLMQSNSYLRTRAVDVASTADFVLVNPPFSQQSTKQIESNFFGDSVRASFAMTYLMRSLEIFNPKLGGVVILPESSLYSDLDESARFAIKKKFGFSILFELSSSTFRGARARTVAIQLVPGSGEDNSQSSPAIPHTERAHVRLRRGTLPVHLADRSRLGTPYIHTTDICRLVNGECTKRFISFRRTGVIKGWVVLLPRVGLPKRDQLVPVFLKQNSILSDCVVAVLCADRQECGLVAGVISGQYLALEDLYRGTGARYVTVAKLRSWLGGLGISVTE